MKIFDYDDLGSMRSWDYSSKGITPEDEGISPIYETDKNIVMRDLFIINNVAYCICSMSGKGGVYNTCYAKRLKNQDVFIYNKEPHKQNYTQNITCPYCGTEIESWEMEDDDDNYICESCGSTFSYSRNVTVEYCSQPVKKGEAIVLD